MIEWKPVRGYEGLYEVSSEGEVRSLDRVDSAGRNLKGVIRKQRTATHGYRQVNLSGNGVHSQKTVHRMVAEAFLESPDGDMWVNHINGDKSDNRVENLEWATPSENMYHAFRTGLSKPRDMAKENHPGSKLTNKERRTIGLMRFMRVPQKVIAEKFGVSAVCVSRQPKVTLVC